MTNSAANRDKYIWLLSLGHMFSDFNQGAVAALLPFLIEQHNYEYAVAAGLIFSMNLISSFVQPFFGYMSDKRNTAWVLPIAILLAGFGFSSLGIAKSYSYLVLGVIISGTGIAAYHPDAAKMVDALAPINKGGKMSIFSFGGNMGFALGPVVTTFLVNMFGIPGVLYLLIPTFLISGIFVFAMPVMAKLANEVKKELAEVASRMETDQAKPEKKDNWKSFTFLILVLTGRSITYYGLNTFLALFWIYILGQTKTSGNLALSLLFIVGALGTLLGGRLADEIGFKKVIQISFVLLPFLLFALSKTTNIKLAFLLLLPTGILLTLQNSSIVVLGQKYLPNNVGLASGVTLGLSVSVGGVATPFLGKIADMTSLVAVFQVLTLITIATAFFSWFLTDER